MIERLIAFALLILLSPLCFVISILIIMEDGFPILYSQKRPGKNHVIFKLSKFRTMWNDTPEVATHELKHPEDYLLKIGRIIRRLSFDEIPNLINVIKGDIRFIGPRPALYNQYDLIALREKYGIDKQKPGITGWAQVNGRDELDISQKVELDKWYLNNRSLSIDIKILYWTFTKSLASSKISH
jgi:O-antigen biosynthesis protein WbqP